MAVAVLLAACGGGDDSSPEASEPGGAYEVRVTEASFPAKQDLGQTSLLELAFRNTGEKTVPVLAVTISIAGKAGESSTLPFAVHDPTPGLAQADRPVWVLAATYPRLQGSSEPGGASTFNAKTFAFGPLKPGQTRRAVWKLSAVRAGDYTLRYRVAAGLGGKAKAETRGGVAPGGSFVTKVTSALPETEVTDSGEVVRKDASADGSRGRAESPKKSATESGPTYHIEIDGSEYPTVQKVGRAYALKLGWRNYGKNRVPMLAVTFSTVKGFISSSNRKKVSGSPAFATGAGPVWSLAPGYPRIAGTQKPAGTSTDGKTFLLGPLEPGERRLTIWKLRALRPGKYSLSHEAAGDLGGHSKTKSPFPGLAPGGWYEVQIASR
jgi:hypothetical protein